MVGGMCRVEVCFKLQKPKKKYKGIYRLSKQKERIKRQRRVLGILQLLMMNECLANLSLTGLSFVGR